MLAVPDRNSGTNTVIDLPVKGGDRPIWRLSQCLVDEKHAIMPCIWRACGFD